MSTDRTFGNMLNEKPVTPVKKEKVRSIDDLKRIAKKKIKKK